MTSSLMTIPLARKLTIARSLTLLSHKRSSPCSIPYFSRATRKRGKGYVDVCGMTPSQAVCLGLEVELQSTGDDDKYLLMPALTQERTTILNSVGSISDSCCVK